MSRVQNNIAKKHKYSQHQITQIKSVSSLLQIFTNQKNKQYKALFLQKIKRSYLNNKKYGKLFASLIIGIASTKKKEYTQFAWRRLQGNILQIKSQSVREYFQLTQQLRKKSTNLIASILHKLYDTKRKNNFKFLITQAKCKGNAQNFKLKHLARVFNQILSRRLREGLEALKINKVRMMKIKTKMRYCDKLVNQKIKYNIQSAFYKLKFTSISICLQKVEAGRDNPVIQNKQTGKRVVASNVSSKQQQQVDEKSAKLQRQMDTFQRQKQKIINDHKKQIRVYEKQNQSLKFNNELLDQSIKDLEIELMQRQKKNVKKLSNKQLWDRVYSHLLFLYSTSNGPISRQSILQALESPLPPINVDIDALKMENQVLAQLIEEYKKFYEVSHDDFVPKQDILPYDILAAKNKFLFSAVEALIDQGIGTEKQIKKLQSDLDLLAKKA